MVRLISKQVQATPDRETCLKCNIRNQIGVFNALRPDRAHLLRCLATMKDFNDFLGGFQYILRKSENCLLTEIEFYEARVREHAAAGRSRFML